MHRVLISTIALALTLGVAARADEPPKATLRLDASLSASGPLAVGDRLDLLSTFDSQEGRVTLYPIHDLRVLAVEASLDGALTVGTDADASELALLAALRRHGPLIGARRRADDPLLALSPMRDTVLFNSVMWRPYAQFAAQTRQGAPAEAELPAGVPRKGQLALTLRLPRAPVGWAPSTLTLLDAPTGGQRRRLFTGIRRLRSRRVGAEASAVLEVVLELTPVEAQVVVHRVAGGALMIEDAAVRSIRPRLGGATIGGAPLRKATSAELRALAGRIGGLAQARVDRTREAAQGD